MYCYYFGTMIRQIILQCENKEPQLYISLSFKMDTDWIF